jgi:hypothetical protein
METIRLEAGNTKNRLEAGTTQVDPPPKSLVTPPARAKKRFEGFKHMVPVLPAA